MTIVQQTAKITTDSYDLLNLSKYFMIPTSVDTDGTQLYLAYIATQDRVIDFIGELPLEELICQWAITGIGMSKEDHEKLQTYLDNNLEFGSYNPEWDKSFFGRTLSKHLLFTRVGSNENNMLKPRQPKKPKSGFIYVVQLDGCMKVGFSADVNARMQQFEATSMRVELLYKVPALLSQEKEFHKLFNNKSEKYTQSAKEIIKVLTAYLNHTDALMEHLKTHKANPNISHFNLALAFTNQV